MTRSYWCLAVVPAIFFLPSFVLKLFLTAPHFEWDACWRLNASECTSGTFQVESAKIEVSDAVLNDMKSRLQNRRAHNFVFKSESSSHLVDEEYGLKHEFLEKILQHWETKFDWRAVESKINTWNPQKVKVDGLDVHFFNVNSPKTKEGHNRKPVLFLHGWPGSFWEFSKIVPMIQNPYEYDIPITAIIPSLPGYGFSQAAEKPGLDICQMGVMFVKLMRGLNYDKFICQGGDWGSLICQCIAVIAPENVEAVHLNFFPMQSPLWSYFVFPHLQPSVFKYIFTVPYLLEQAAAPNTIGLALSDSPASLTAWILEKMVVWSDPNSNLTLDDYVTNIMIYWVTDSIFTSVRLYKESIKGLNSNMMKFINAGGVSSKAWLCAFPNEIMNPPLKESVVKTHFHNLMELKMQPKGGHFAALEVPEILYRDIQTFLKTLLVHEKV